MAEVKPIRRVSAYQTSDGERHATRVAAEAHETRAELTALVRGNLPLDGADDHDLRSIVDGLLAKPAIVLAAIKAHTKLKEAA